MTTAAPLGFPASGAAVSKEDDMRGRQIRRRGRCWTVEQLPADSWRYMDIDAGRRMARHWPGFSPGSAPRDSEPTRRDPIDRTPEPTDPGEHNRGMRTRARNTRIGRRRR